jgi:hypothetical protein
VDKNKVYKKKNYIIEKKRKIVEEAKAKAKEEATTKEITQNETEKKATTIEKEIQKETE